MNYDLNVELLPAGTALVPWGSTVQPEVIYPNPHYAEREIFCGPFLPEGEYGTRRYVRTSGLHFNVQEVLSKLGRNETIDIFVADLQEQGTCFVTGLEQLSCLKIAKILDTHHGYHPIGSLIDYLEKEPIDHVLCLAQHAHIHFFLEAGCRHIASVPRSGPPPNIKPTGAKKEFPVTYVGRKWSHAHPYRNWMVQYLEKTLPQLGIPFCIHTYCSHQEWLNVVSRSLITVCSSLNGQFTPQVFNIMHAGSLCLTDELSPQTGLYEFFEPGRHFVTWRDYNDLVEKIRYYVEHPAEAKKIALAGQRRAEECFPANRLEGRAIFDFAVSDKLPPEFRPEIDRRCGVIRSKNKSEFQRRVCMYENMQELHRVHKRLRVIGWQLNDNAPVADLVDLPRLEISCMFSSPESRNEWRDVFEQAGVLKQVELLTVDDNVKPASFDIGIVDAATLSGGNVARFVNCLKPRALLWVLGDINDDGHKKLKQGGFRQFDFNSVEMRLQRTIIPRFRYYLPQLVFPAPLLPATELITGLQAYQRGGIGCNPVKFDSWQTYFTKCGGSKS